MYCTKCGHPIQDTDRFCGNCGSPVGSEVVAADQPVQEEIIYNAPSGSVHGEDASHYPRELSLAFEEKEDTAPPKHSVEPEQEIQEEAQPECTCDFSEFSWNVQDFPKPQKVDQVPIRWGVSSESSQVRESIIDEPFVWNLGDMSGESEEEKIQEKKEARQQIAPREPASEPYIQSVPKAAGTALHELTEEEADRIRRMEEEIFSEAKASKSIKVSDTVHLGNDADEVFFTFSKKNEEFQKLLDREYDKVQKRKEEDQDKEKQGILEKIELPMDDPGDSQPIREAIRFTQEQSAAPSMASVRPETVPGQSAAPSMASVRPETVPGQSAAPSMASVRPEMVPGQPAAPSMASVRPEMVPGQPAAPSMASVRPETVPGQPAAPSMASVRPETVQRQPESSRHTKPISRNEVKEAVKKYILNLSGGAEAPTVSQDLPTSADSADSATDFPHSGTAAKSAIGAMPRRQALSPKLPSEQKPAISITLGSADQLTSDPQTDRILPDEVLAARKTLHDFNLMQEMESRSVDFHESKDEAPQSDQPQVKRPVGYVNPQADEMVKARAGFFGSTASLDYVQVEQEESRDKSDVPPTQAEAEPKNQSGENYNPTAAPGNFYYEGPAASKKKKRLRIVKWVVLAVVVLALVVEGTILGVKYFAPQSAAAAMIQRAEQSVAGLFQKKDGEPIPDSDQMGEQQDVDQQENLPTATMDELIQQQIGNNYNNNIEKVEANPNLKYDAQKDYGVADVNASMPIMDNFWLESNGIRYNYDATVVGTVIAYCSKWTSYVNDGDESVFSMLASGGAADQRAKDYKSENGVHQTVTSLQLGEIRRGANGFYIWTQEDITVKKGGQSQQKQEKYIYYMAPNGRSFQVIDYYPY